MNLTTNLMLFKAVSDGSKEVIEFLIAAGADVNFIVPERFIKEIDYLPVIPSEDFTFSPLHVAIINNNIEAIKILINKGANVNQFALKFTTLTPIIFALNKTYNSYNKSLQFEMVKLLVEAQAELNNYYESKTIIKESLPWMKNYRGSPLEIAFRLNDDELMKLFINFGANYNITITNYFYITKEEWVVNSHGTFEDISQRLFRTREYADLLVKYNGYIIDNTPPIGMTICIPVFHSTKSESLISILIKTKKNEILNLIINSIYRNKNIKTIIIDDFLKKNDFHTITQYIGNSSDINFFNKLLKLASYYKVYANIQIPEILINFITTDQRQFMFYDKYRRRLHTTYLNDKIILDGRVALFKNHNTNEQVKIFLKQAIPASMDFGTAINNNDCFFDSVTQSLANIGMKGFTVKRLRKICHNYVVSLNKSLKGENWIYQYFLSEALKLNSSNERTTTCIASSKYQHYLSNIYYTETEIEEGQGINTSAAISGRLDIEGRIFYEQLGKELYIIELLDTEDGYRLIHRLNGIFISKTDSIFEVNDSIHLACFNKHFVPILFNGISDNYTHEGSNIKSTKQWIESSILHTAADTGNLEAINIITHYFPQLFMVKNNFNREPIESAQDNQKYDAIRLLKGTKDKYKKLYYSNLLTQFGKFYNKKQTSKTDSLPFPDIKFHFMK